MEVWTGGFLQKLFSSILLEEYAIYPVKQNIVDTFDSIQETLFPYKQGVKVPGKNDNTTNWRFVRQWCCVPHAACLPGAVQLHRGSVFFVGFFLIFLIFCLAKMITYELYMSFICLRVTRCDEMWVHSAWSERLVRCPASSFHDFHERTHTHTEVRHSAAWTKNGEKLQDKTEGRISLIRHVDMFLLIDCVRCFGVYSGTARTVHR